MKNITLSVVLLTLVGCSSISYNRTMPDGSKASASARSLFSTTAIKGFNADSNTEKTSTGLKFQSTDTTAQGEALGTIIGTALKTAK